MLDILQKKGLRINSKVFETAVALVARGSAVPQGEGEGGPLARLREIARRSLTEEEVNGIFKN
jgi:hypothetical protein